MANYMKSTLPLVAVWMLPALLPYGASAQAPAVPTTFQNTYNSLNTYLTKFNATLNAGPAVSHPFVSTGNLKNADANAGPQLINGATMAGVQLQLQELKAMGVQGVAVEVGFPVLYEPFLTSQGQTYAQYVAFYQQVAAMVRAAGLKLIVENDTLLVNDAQAGWNAAAFYATLDWAQYQQARAQTAVTVAETMKPDYLVVVQEPDTEAANSGQSQANTPSGSAALLSQILTSVEQADVPGMKVGAGTGSWQASYLQFIQGYVALPVDFIDMHIYPVNDNMLPNALTIASTAAAAGKPVSMTECWMWKISDSELGVLTPSQVRSRNPFSFWAPLDASFIQAMQNLANHTQMLFMNPFNTEAFSAYLTYGTAAAKLSPGAITGQENAQAAQNMGQASFTSTAMSYYASLVPSDKVPPSVPAGLAGVSGNPTTASLSWNASTDNVGVAGYHVLRNGSIVGTTANLYYQDSKLTESATYSYTVEAFDLAGNTSAPSLRVSVTTRDVTPPTTPTGVVAKATSSETVVLSWSRSKDNIGISSYIVFWGVSPASLIQVGRAQSMANSYTSYPLTAGTTYYYGVEAADGSGNVSAMSTIVSVATPMPPAPPTHLVATPLSAAKVGLTWSAAVAGGLPVANYHVYRGTTSSTLSQIAIVLATSYTDSNVTAKATYYYAVVAADSGSDQSAASATAEVIVPAAPSAPTKLVVVAPSKAQVSLSWAAAPGGLPLASYNVYKGSSTSRLTLLKVVSATSAATTDSAVLPGVTYYYGIQAKDTGGDISPMSAIVSVTTSR